MSSKGASGSSLAAVIGMILGAASAQAQPAPSPAAAAPAAPPPPALSLMGAAVPCSDPQRSLDFYTRGLGLKLATRLDTANATELILAFPGGGPNLMLLKSKDASAPLPIRGPLNRVVLATRDMTALQARLAAAGYRLQAPPHEEGRFHVVVGGVQDPDGNLIELVQRGP